MGHSCAHHIVISRVFLAPQRNRPHGQAIGLADGLPMVRRDPRPARRGGGEGGANHRGWVGRATRSNLGPTKNGSVFFWTQHKIKAINECGFTFGRHLPPKGYPRSINAGRRMKFYPEKIPPWKLGLDSGTIVAPFFSWRRMAVLTRCVACKPGVVSEDGSGVKHAELLLKKSAKSLPFRPPPNDGASL